MKYLLLLFSFPFYGQVLHHQMIASQGQSKNIANVAVIQQTIGQQSIVGTNGKDFIVMQGFQQSLWGKYIASSLPTDVSGIIVTTFPNSFTETVNFQFSEPVTDAVLISVFDVTGRQVYRQDKVPINTILTVNLSILPSSTYLVRLQTAKLNYYTQILKK